MRGAKRALVAVRAVLAGLTLVAASPGAAEPPAPDSFAAGFTVTAEGEGGLWEVELPEAVYETAVRGDLGDLRVFDAAGRPVDHVLEPPRAETGVAPEPLALAFFPLLSTGGREPGRRLVIERDADGRATGVRSEAVAGSGDRRVVAWLVDAGVLGEPGSPGPPARLALSWRLAEGEGGFATTVDVEASDDLAHWRRLVARAALADLAADGAHLVQDEIALPPERPAYLLVDWPAELAAVTVTGVRALFDPPATAAPSRWLRLAGALDHEQPPGILYTARGVRPVDRARLDLGPSGGIVEGTLSSRPDGDAPWTRRCRGLFYSLERGGSRLASPPSRFRVTRDALWRLVPEEAERLAAPLPALELGWRPHRLTFVAQGPSPYTVAFGSGSVESGGRPLSGLLAGLEEDRRRELTVEAAASEVFPLGGVDRLLPPREPFPWRTALLWAILVTGVGLLAWMVRGLLRQVGGGPPAGGR